MPPDERIVVEPKPLDPDLAPENEARDGARIGCVYTWPPLIPPFPVVGRAWDVNVGALRYPRYTFTPL
jgi:hypothetical protein